MRLSTISSIFIEIDEWFDLIKLLNHRSVNLPVRAFFLEVYFLNAIFNNCSFVQVGHKMFGNPILELPDEPVITNPPVLIFGDFLKPSVPQEDRIYEEITDMTKLRLVLQVRNYKFEKRNFILVSLWYSTEKQAASGLAAAERNCSGAWLKKRWFRHNLT